MIVLDANVLIAFLDPSNALHERAVDVFVDNADDSLRVSALTLAEALVYPTRHSRQVEALERISELGVRVDEIAADSAIDIARVRSATSLRLPDAVVLEAARRRGAAVATFDARLAAAARDAGVAVVPA